MALCFLNGSHHGDGSGSLPFYCLTLAMTLLRLESWLPVFVPCYLPRAALFPKSTLNLCLQFLLSLAHSHLLDLSSGLLLPQLEASQRVCAISPSFSGSVGRMGALCSGSALTE